MINFSGKPTISPWFYVSGKTAGYLTWLFFTLSILDTGLFNHSANRLSRILTLIFLVLGVLLIILSSVFLGNSVRIGLPLEETILKTGGIYRFSRNPMYLGIHSVTLASMAYTFSIWVILPGLYSFFVYHLIVLGEEKFLEERFGEKYLDYRQKVRRYF
jgi:protein-S-isoprenylcysteine O-methyltransferase Ste14